MEHPDRGEIIEYATSGLVDNPDEGALRFPEVVKHLRTNCSQCTTIVRETLTELGPTDETGEDYDWPLVR